MGNNAINPVDPSGKIAPLLFIGAVVGLTALDVALDYAFYRAFGDRCQDFDWVRSIVVHGAMNAVTLGVGGRLFALGWLGRYVAMVALDTTVSTAFDMWWRGQPLGPAVAHNLVGNAIGYGIGQGIGFVGSAVGGWFKRTGEQATRTATRGGAEPVRIGQRGVQYVVKLLEQAREPVLRREAYFPTSRGGARIDIETEHFLIEVKTQAKPSMSKIFRERADKYLEISQEIALKPLVYYFTNRGPNEPMKRFFRSLGIKWEVTPMP